MPFTINRRPTFWRALCTYASTLLAVAIIFAVLAFPFLLVYYATVLGYFIATL